ncbi:MAG: type II toxin-antitoxin system VapC family toxin [Solirubrobacteraceae bacterium]
MRLLLDTQALLWATEDRLDPRARDVITNTAEAVFVSAATIWEIEIKRALGRLRAPPDVVQRVDESGYERLAITFEHACEAGRLPPLHGDPFDRMLVAQARLEGMTLASSDESIRRYDVSVLEVTRR